ncbi:MAG: hypothetical protein Q8R33_09430 [Burkholderiales bacterium]|nr:hypothetical protein [Burkholderiales bacterium]
MTDKRNIMHDKKVQQEKKHRHQEVKPGAAGSVQPGRKPQMAPPPEAPNPATDVPDADTPANTGKPGA